jgi:prevent-host-death family protein
MSAVSSRDLRNHTADVLRRVADGDRVVVTVNGAPVAELGPVPSQRRRSMSKHELIALLDRRQADAGLTADLELLTGDTTDDLDELG